MSEESNIAGVFGMTAVDGRLFILPTMPTIRTAEKLQRFMSNELKVCNTFSDAVSKILLMGGSIYYSIPFNGYIITPIAGSFLSEKMNDLVTVKQN